MKRHLAAILAADVVGYSRLMEQDEAGTFARLRALRTELFEPQIARHHGRIFKVMGDGLLAEFLSVVDAVACAVALQSGLAARNLGIDDGRRIDVRVGINLDDVIAEGDDRHGEGVNIAARLQELAEPGGIAVSRTVAEHVERKLQVRFEGRGKHQLKNIAEPVYVYRIRSPARADTGCGLPREAASLPTRPAVAVLAFDNMSGDPAQQYFSDGITEDIITALSRVKWFLVIARNSSFTYRDRSVDVKQVARELGVHYVLEGSVRKAGERVRITGQLIQADTGAHIWADRFDGELSDVFDLQDQITASVVAAIEPSLRRAEIDRARRKPTERLDAHDWYLRALPPFYTLTREGVDEAIALLDRAIGIDPHFALAKALAARCHAWRDPLGWATAPAERATAVRLGREALREGADDPSVLWMVGFAMWQLRVDFDGALELYDRSLALNPNCPQALTLRGWALATTGRLDEATAALSSALRLSPFDPETFFTMSALGWTCLMAERFDEALEWTSRALRARPTFAPALRFHAVALAEVGRLNEARDAVARLLVLEPGLTASSLRRRAPVPDARLMGIYLEGLRRAGLPD
ncbi:adenylate/guanylate cyclase domain-containing protein [Chelatococcus reniformis]|uniref:Adenylate cyclase n=1 Tax=Chelatococcus reniformis TaxID=1494448 RepID=A0A916UPT1_9HYPH|nr:adenylate/guanylate cyclase domain-containing protein [Chelatococcus reniformis]GGC82380.1 adenylate cyclase [Chelatococcus reniformis]